MPETFIHPTAIIEKGAVIDSGCFIGPYCMVSAASHLGKHTKLHSHVVISGHVTIGENCEFFPFSSIGMPPQDLKFQGEITYITIGNNNRIRENVTIHPGTIGGGSITRIGNNNLLMIGAHIAHDCQIGNHCIIVNNGTLAGHVTVNDGAIIGGHSAVHQFCRIGQNAMVGGMTGVEKDVAPYCTVMGNRASLVGLNLIGLKRLGLDRDILTDCRAAYKDIFEGKSTLQERLENAKQKFATIEPIMQMINFLQEPSHRSFCLPEKR